MTMRQTFLVILDCEPDGKYSVYCPALPGCCSQGDDRMDALRMIKDAIIGVLELVEERRPTSPEVANLPLQETPELLAAELRDAMAFRMEEGGPVAMEIVGVEVTAPVPA